MDDRSGGPVYELTARELATAVATGALTPDAIVDAALGHIASVEPDVRAWSYLDEARARREARELTREASAGRLRGPLHGVPIGVKDEFHVRGMPTRQRAEGAAMEPADSTAVARLRAAGAVILGKLQMPIDGVAPPTRNPWDLARTPGGSSSGSGAAVAARMVPVALGEQTGGSGLRPAAFCGVAALKPTYGRISRYGCYPFSWSFDHPVIIGLDVADIALVLAVASGPDPADAESLPDEPPDADLRMTDMGPPTIGVVENFFPERTDGTTRDALHAAVSAFERRGAQLVSVRLPDEFALTWEIHRIIGRSEGALLAPDVDRGDGGRGLNEWQLENLVGRLIPATYYLQAQRIRRRLRREIPRSFGDLDALLMAATPGPAPLGLRSTGDPSLLTPWSALGFPAITINGGLSPEGLPLGLQLVARPKLDHRLCQVAAWCERILGRLPAPSIVAMRRVRTPATFA